jgi:hypothetical protein
MYAGLGQSLGSLIGGAMCKRYGIQSTFQYCAAIDFGIFSVFLAYQGILNLRLAKIDAISSKPTLTTDKETFKGGSKVDREEAVKSLRPMPLIIWSKDQGLARFAKKLLGSIYHAYSSLMKAVRHEF